MIIVHGLIVEQFAGVIGVVSSLLEPDGKIGFVETLADEFRVPPLLPIRLSRTLKVSLSAEVLTVWRTDVGDICVVCSPPRPQTHA